MLLRFKLAQNSKKIISTASKLLNNEWKASFEPARFLLSLPCRNYYSVWRRLQLWTSQTCANIPTLQQLRALVTFFIPPLNDTALWYNVARIQYTELKRLDEVEDSHALSTPRPLMDFVCWLYALDQSEFFKDNKFPYMVIVSIYESCVTWHCYSLGLRVTCIKIASGEKVYHLRILHPLSNTRRRRCISDAVSFFSSSFQNKSCAQSVRKFRQTTTTWSRVRKSLRHHRQHLAQVNLLRQFIIKLLHIIFRYQFLWSTMVTLLATGTFRAAMERLWDSNRTR